MPKPGFDIFDARKVAAAPEVYEALKALHDAVVAEGLERDKQDAAADNLLRLLAALKSASTALAKATGVPNV